MINAVRRSYAWVRGREPLVAVNIAAGAVTAAVAEWQGDLSGDAAWLAVGWGLLVLVARQVVAPHVPER